jgi:7-cyano-7-deazaguanine synthase
MSRRNLLEPVIHAKPPAALVLLSGGLDSVAALHSVLETGWETAAVSFSYGQPQRDQELAAAQKIAERRGVPWASLHLGNAVRGHVALDAPAPGLASVGVSRANLAARNAIMLSTACAHAARLWPAEPSRHVHLVIGCNVDDARGFPDCRQDFLGPMGRALSAAVAPLFTAHIHAPWAEKTKAEIVAWCAARPDAAADIADSVSCYAGTACGTCDACTLRARAGGPRDGTTSLQGGDPAREARLR